MFSDNDFALAAKVLGLPMPMNDAERAAAIPMTNVVMRDMLRAQAPGPTGNQQDVYIGPTRSLNNYPNVEQPMAKAQLASRLMTTEVRPESMDPVLVALIEQVMQDPALIMEFLAVLDKLDQQQEEEMQRLSAQRPMEYDMPNLGGNYSVLNAPSSNGIPPSQSFQPLS